MNIFSIVIGGILLISILRGYRRGFIKVVVSLLSVVLTIALVAIVTPYIGDFLQNETPFYNLVKEKCYENFAEANSQSANENSEEQVRTIENYDLPEYFKTVLIENNNGEVYQNLFITKFEDYASSYMAKMITNATAFVITFLMITIFLRMTFFTLDIIAELPVLKGLNRFIGIFAGGIEGLLIVWVLFLGILMCSGTDFGQSLMSDIRQSNFLLFLYNHNYLLRFIVSI